MPQSWKERGALVFTNTVLFTAAGNHQIVNGAGVVVNKTVGAATGISAPKVLELGRTFFVKDAKGDATTNNITVTDPAGHTIDGAASFVINFNYGEVWFRWNKTEWNVVQVYDGGGSSGGETVVSITGAAATLPITGLAGTAGTSGTGGAGGTVLAAGGPGGAVTTGTGGAGGAGNNGGAGGNATGTAGIGGAGGAGSGGSGGAGGTATTGMGGAGGTANPVGGVGGTATTGTGGAGGVGNYGGGAGGATTAGTGNGGAGAAANFFGGAGGNSFGGNGGAGGPTSLDGGAAGTGGTPGTAGYVAIGDVKATATYINRGPRTALFNALTLTSIGTSQNSTPTAAQVLGGLITQTGATGAGTVTLPTGGVLAAACARVPVAGDQFECVFANLGGGQTLTLTAGASGMTMQGTVAVPTGKNARMKFYCTATNTFTVFCELSA